MQELKGNIWSLLVFDQKVDAICITTNGFVKKDGACVMGRGIALEAKNKFPKIDYKLGELITQFGNVAHPLMNYGNCCRILSFPTKHVWWDNSDISLIQESCRQVMSLADEFNLQKILLPRPGCGNGGLKWDDVKPQIENLLDDRFFVVTF